VNDCPNHIKKDRSTKRQTGAELPRGRRDMGRRIASIALKQARRDQDESSSLFGYCQSAISSENRCTIFRIML